METPFLVKVLWMLNGIVLLVALAALALFIARPERVCMERRPSRVWWPFSVDQDAR